MYIDGSVNSYEVNGLAVNDSFDDNQGIAIAAGTAIKIRQNVAINAAVNLAIRIAQDVQFRATLNGTMLKIRNNIRAKVPAANAIKISQNIYNKQQPTFFIRNGWEPILTIDGGVIARDMIYGTDITVTMEENQSNQCTFTLLVKDPVTLINSIWGKNITLDYVSRLQGTTRVFTGVVAIPEIDIINGYVKFTCSNNRDELINNQLKDIKNYIGRYSDKVQSEVKTVAEELNERLKTIPSSLDFDGNNIYSINSWYAKDVADYTYDGSEIYYREPKVVWQDRTKVKNSIDIDVSYQYTRLYNYSRNFSWNFPYDFCTFVFGQYSVPNIQVIEDAIDSAKWKNLTPIVYTSVFPPGTCTDGALVYAWNTSSFANQGTYSTIFDSNGNVISDPDGNNVYGFKPFPKDFDRSLVLVIGAEWQATTRFSQYVTEEYSLKVKSTQSINQFGVVTDVQRSSIDEDYDSSDWDDFTKDSVMPARAVGNLSNYYVNTDSQQADLQNTILTNIDMAKTAILDSHRNTRVIIQTPVKPFLSVKQTVALDGKNIRCKGKVQSVTHVFDIADGKDCYTTVTIALFRSMGNATTSATQAPNRPIDDVQFPNATIVLGTHYGVDDEAYNGYIGNKSNPRVVGQLLRTNVQEQFRVDTPKVDEEYTKNRSLAVSQEYEVAIPNDLLEVTLLR